jgi:hypothetical protein
MKFAEIFTDSMHGRWLRTPARIVLKPAFARRQFTEGNAQPASGSRVAFFLADLLTNRIEGKRKTPQDSAESAGHDRRGAVRDRALEESSGGIGGA